MKIALDLKGSSLKKGWNGAVRWDDEEISVSGKTVLGGLGKKEKFTLEKARRAAAKFLMQAKTLKVKELALDLSSFGGKFSSDEIAHAVVEGARMFDYRFDKYKSKPAPASGMTLTLALK